MTLFEAMDDAPAPARGGGGGGGWLSSFFGGGGGGGEGEACANASGASSPAAPPPGIPYGLYMHGGVGTGKTMLMDLFVEAVAGVTPVSLVFFFSWAGHHQARAQPRVGSFFFSSSLSLPSFPPAMTRRHLKTTIAVQSDRARHTP
jgi:hypothetical protein